MCPNVSGGIDFATDPEVDFRRVVFGANSWQTPADPGNKLTPNALTNIVGNRPGVIAEAGADAGSLINTLGGLAIDWRRRRSILGTLRGWSGLAIKLIARVWSRQVARSVQVPITSGSAELPASTM